MSLADQAFVWKAWPPVGQEKLCLKEIQEFNEPPVEKAHLHSDESMGPEELLSVLKEDLGFRCQLT